MLKILVAYNNIHKTVIVEIDQSHPVVVPVWGFQGLSAEEVFSEAFTSFTEIEELDLGAVLLGDVIDPLDHLGVPHPASRMEDKIKNTLFEHGYVDRRFPVLNSYRVAIAVKMLSLPIAGHHAWHFPNAITYSVGIRIVFNGDDVGIEWDIFFKLCLSI